MVAAVCESIVSLANFDEIPAKWVSFTWLTSRSLRQKADMRRQGGQFRTRRACGSRPAGCGLRHVSPQRGAIRCGGDGNVRPSATCRVRVMDKIQLHNRWLTSTKDPRHRRIPLGQTVELKVCRIRSQPRRQPPARSTFREARTGGFLEDFLKIILLIFCSLFWFET